MNRRLRNVVRIASALIVSITASLALTACGSGDTTEGATQASSREAGASLRCASEVYRCTRLTVQNESGGWIKVMANGRDQGEHTIGIGSGSTGEVSGYWGSWGGVDLRGEVWDLEGRTSAYHNFEARNPQVGAPSIGFWNAQNRDMRSFSVGETQTFALMSNRAFDVTREPDSEHFIEFRAKYRRGK